MPPLSGLQVQLSHIDGAIDVAASKTEPQQLRVSTENQKCEEMNVVCCSAQDFAGWAGRKVNVKLEKHFQQKVTKYYAVIFQPDCHQDCGR